MPGYFWYVTSSYALFVLAYLGMWGYAVQQRRRIRQQLNEQRDVGSP